jgi:hypothetical protein
MFLSTPGAEIESHQLRSDDHGPRQRAGVSATFHRVLLLLLLLLHQGQLTQPRKQRSSSPNDVGRISRIRMAPAAWSLPAGGHFSYCVFPIN